MTPTERLVDSGNNIFTALNDFTSDTAKDVYITRLDINNNEVTTSFKNLKKLTDIIEADASIIEATLSAKVVETYVVTDVMVSGNFSIINASKGTTLTALISNAILNSAVITHFKIDWNDGTDVQEVLYDDRFNISHTFPTEQDDGTQITIEITAHDNVGNASRIKEVVLTYRDNSAPAGDIVGNLGGYLEPGTWVGTYSGATDEDGTIQSYKVQNISTEYLTVQEAIVNAGTDHIFDLEEFDGDNIEVTYEVVAIDDKDAESSPELFTITCSGLLNANSDKFIYDEDSYNLLDSSLSTITQEADQEDFRKVKATLYNEDPIFGENKINDDLLLELDQILEPEQTIISIHGLSRSVMVLLNDGTIKCCGSNGSGQLGVGNTTDQSSWVTSNISNIKELYCGGSHSFAILNDGTIKCCGSNNNGQLGIGNTTTQSSWVDSGISEVDISQIELGDRFSLILLKSGSLKSTGSNDKGQLGIGNTTDQSSWETSDISDVKSIYCGNKSSFVILNDNSVKCCGYDGNDMLGSSTSGDQSSWVDSDISDVKSFTIKGYTSVALLNDGTLKFVGLNSGQYGNDNTDTSSSWTNSNISDVVKIVGNNYNSFAILSDGTIKGCGKNSEGELGIGNTDEQSSWITITSEGDDVELGKDFESYLILKDGSMKCAGRNISGGLGIGNTDSQLSWVDTLTVDDILRSKQEIVDIQGYYQNSMALLSDGTAFAVGRNYFGELGTNSTDSLTNWTSISISNIKEICCNDGFTIFLLNDGTLKSVGNNSYGQLGIDNTTDQTSIVNISLDNIKHIYVSRSYTIHAVSNDGKLYCWGRNNNGEAGVGNADNILSPTLSIENIVDFYNPGIANHCIVKLNDNSFKVCGQLNDNFSFANVGSVDKQSTWISCEVPDSENIKKMLLGYQSNVILYNNGTVYGIGAQASGQFNTGNTDTLTVLSSLDVTEIDDIKYDNNLLCVIQGNSYNVIGENTDGQLGIGSNTDEYSFSTVAYDLKNIFLNQYKTFAIKNNDTSLIAVGHGGYDCLGTGNSDDQNTWVTSNLALSYIGYKINTKEMVLPTGTREVTLTSTASLTKAEVSLWTI